MLGRLIGHRSSLISILCYCETNYIFLIYLPSILTHWIELALLSLLSYINSWITAENLLWGHSNFKLEKRETRVQVEVYAVFSESLSSSWDIKFTRTGQTWGYSPRDLWLTTKRLYLFASTDAYKVGALECFTHRCVVLVCNVCSNVRIYESVSKWHAISFNWKKNLLVVVGFLQGATPQQTQTAIL